MLPFKVLLQHLFYLEVYPMAVSIIRWLPMHFSARLLQIRKAQGLTQQGLGDAANLHINQIRRYESGSAQPTLEGLIKLAKSLHVSLDELVFDENERAPHNEKMKLLFEAVERLDDGEQNIIRELLEGMIVKYEARRWDKTTRAK
jgi:transcriptional regulator with XRE-family HTH domain